MNTGIGFLKFEAPAVFRRGYFFARKGDLPADRFPNFKAGRVIFLSGGCDGMD